MSVVASSLTHPVRYTALIPKQCQLCTIRPLLVWVLVRCAQRNWYHKSFQAQHVDEPRNQKTRVLWQGGLGKSCFEADWAHNVMVNERTCKMPPLPTRFSRLFGILTAEYIVRRLSQGRHRRSHLLKTWKSIGFVAIPTFIPGIKWRTLATETRVSGKKSKYPGINAHTSPRVISPL